MHALTDKIKNISARYLGTKSPAVTTPQSVLACDYGKSKIVFLELEKTPAGVSISQFKKISRPNTEAKTIEVLKQAVEESKFGTNRVRLSVKGQGVVVRFIQFPKMKAVELRSALSFETEKYIPFKAEEVIIDYAILDEDAPGSSGKMMNLLLVAVKKEDIYSTINVFQSSGLNVDLIDVDSLAFLNGVECFYPEDCKGSVALLDIGTDISTLVISRNNMPRFIRDISFGGADLIKRLKRKLGMSDLEAIEQLEIDKAPSAPAAEILKEGIKNLIADFKVSIDYYMDQMQPTEGVKKLFLGGSAGYLPLVLKTFSDDLGFPVEAMDVAGKVTLKEGVDINQVKKNSSLLSVAFGLGLRDL